MLDHIVRLHFVLEEIVKLSSKVAVSFCVPIAVPGSSSCFSTPSASAIVSAPDFGRSNKGIVVSHCYFILQFFNDIQRGASFNMIGCHLYIFFDEWCLFRSFALFLGAGLLAKNEIATTLHEF